VCSNLPLISLSIRFQCCPCSHAPSFHRCAWLLPARAVTRCSSTRFARALALERGDGDTGANGCECPRGHGHEVSLATARVENLNTPLASHDAIVTALPDARPPDGDPPVRRSSCVRARVAVVPLCEGATLLLVAVFWFASHSLLPISCVPSQSSFCQELITITHSSWPSGHELL
jgi:hypothetical protein